MIDLQVQYGQCNMDNYIEYLICFCLNGSSVSQFFANVCLHVTFTIMCVNFILHIRITIDWQTIIINCIYLILRNNKLQQMCLIAKREHTHYNFCLFQPRLTYSDLLIKTMNTFIKYCRTSVMYNYCLAIYLYNFVLKSFFNYKKQTIAILKSFATFLRSLTKTTPNIVHVYLPFKLGLNALNSMTICLSHCKCKHPPSYYLVLYCCICLHTCIRRLCARVVYMSPLNYFLIFSQCSNISMIIEFTNNAIICISHYNYKDLIMYISIFLNNGLFIAARYEALFIIMPCVLAHAITIYIKLLYILILYKVTKSYLMYLHRLILISPKQWLI